MRTFRTGEIARALGVSPRRITTAVDRGLIPGDRDPGTGHRRTFTRGAVHHFAILTRLAALGINHGRASVLATKHGHASGVLVVTGTDACVQPAGFSVPEAAILVDLSALRASVDERLAA